MDKHFLKDVAKMVNISPIALEIYVVLMKHGEISSEKLIDVSEKPDTVIQEAIAELSRHRLIRTGGEDNQMFLARTLLEMQDEAEQYQQRIRDLKNFVLPKLREDEEKKFFGFHGWDEIRAASTEFLENARKSKANILAFENNLVNDNLGDDFIEKFVELRTKYKVKAFVICPDQKEDKAYKKAFQGEFTKIKLIENIVIDENINIAGNAVMSFSPDTLDGDFQRNISKANTLRSVFWKLWNG